MFILLVESMFNIPQFPGVAEQMFYLFLNEPR